MKPDPINISIRFNGPIRRPWPETYRYISIEPLSTIQQLLEHLGFSVQDISSLHFSVNRVSARPSYALRQDDNLEVWLRVAGG